MTTKNIRDKIDQILLENVSSNLASDSFQEYTSPTKYAWVPLVTAFCPSELGTSSDQCCGGGNCSGSDSERDEKIDSIETPEDSSEIKPSKPVLSLSSLINQTVNPF